MRLIFVLLFLPLVALGQSFTVLVNSNGVIRYPTNLFAANSNALVAVTGSGGGGGSVASTDITDSTAAGRTLLTAADAAAQRSSLGLGTSATMNVAASGNAASGEVVKGNDTRLTDARTPTSHTHPASEISDSTAAGRALLTAANAEAQRTALGLGALALVADAPANGVDHVRRDNAWVTNTSSGGTTNLVSASAAGLAPQATLANAVLATDGSTNVAWAAKSTIRSATLASFRAHQGEPPASNYATMSTRNSIGTMLYDHTTQEALRFRFVMPEGTTATTATVVLKWTTSATSGDGRWGARAMVLTGDIDSDSFDTAVEGATTTSGTAGTVMTTTLSAVSLDGAAAGDWVWMEVYRDAADAGDTINSNDLELHGVEVRAE